ncbi:MAG: sigma 54-interacting transcriptional regulator [Vicinamibacterales bacterium]
MEAVGALIRAAQSLTLHLEADRVCRAVVDAAVEIFEARCCCLLLRNRETGTLEVKLHRGLAADLVRPGSPPLDPRFAREVVEKGEMVFVRDVRTDYAWADTNLIRQTGLQSACAVPLVYRGEAIGVLGVDSPRFASVSQPSERDVGLLEALAAQAAIAIANAEIFEKVVRDRKRLEAILEGRDRLAGRVQRLRSEIGTAADPLIGSSAAFRAVIERAEMVAATPTTVLLCGETGTGKELLARFIHERSPRSKGPFLAVNCSAIPDALVESELFGHERGAFTGARGSRLGHFEVARGGTLFLDEIADLAPAAQPKILRALQEHAIQRVGSNETLRADVRVVAATNQGLEAAVREGRFRADLYYRLSVFPIRVPPLRERPEDILPLFQHFSAQAARRLGRQLEGVDHEAGKRLVSYCWPGNVRELRNVAERAVLLTTNGAISKAVLAFSGAPADLGEEGILPLAEAQRRGIVKALEQAGGRISGKGGAAELLGVNPTTLYAKMNKLGIRKRGTRE